MQRSRSEFVPAKEAAEKLGVGLNWISVRVGKEGHPFYKRGRRVVIPRDEFEAYRKQKIIK